MGNTLSCASGDSQSLRKSKLNFNFRERYRGRSLEMNSKGSEKLKSDNNLRKVADNGDKKSNTIENKIIDDGIQKVRRKTHQVIFKLKLN